MNKAIARWTTHPMELHMNSQDPSDPIISEITTGCLHLRKLFLPSYQFDQCTVMHSMLGQNIQLSNPPSFAVAFLWHVSWPNHVYVFPAQSCDYTNFSPVGWAFILFSGSLGYSKGQAKDLPLSDGDPDDPPIR